MKYPHVSDHDFRIGDFVRYTDSPTDRDTGDGIETMRKYRDEATTLTVTRIKPSGFILAAATGCVLYGTDTPLTFSYHPEMLTKVSLTSILASR